MMMQLARLWLGAMMALCVALPTWAAPAPDSVLFLSAAPTQPGKFERLQDIAAREGVRVEVRFVEKFSGQEKASDFAGFGLLVIDAPYG